MDLRRLVNLEDSLPHIPIGLVGSGPALDALIGIMSRNDLPAAFPRAKLAGWVLSVPYTGRETALPPTMRDLPRFNTVAALLEASPDIMILADLSPDSRHMPLVRQAADRGVSLISAHMVLLFCALFDAGRLDISGKDSPKKSQMLFSLIVDQIKGDLFIIDGNSNILDVNMHAANSIGMPVSHIIGLSCNDLNTFGYFTECDEGPCPHIEAILTNKPSIKTQPHITKGGRMRYMQSACYPIPDSQGGDAFYLYLRRDVTHEHHMEQRLQQTEKMAAIGELSTYIAHEIRNPLFAIGGFANALLRNPSLSDDAREKARIIHEESRRLDIILKNILNFARPMQQTLGECDAGAIARQTLDLMTMGGEERGISSHVEIPPDLPKALGNADNLKQGLVNIIKNAIEAMPDGGTLTLKASLADNLIRIDVTDTGTGIKPEHQYKIFSPFFSTKKNRTGLGLAMTRKAIGEMGGNVSFKSRPGKGSTISLFIPVALDLEQNQSADQGVKTAGDKPQMGTSHHPERVIVLATRNKGKIREFSSLLAPFALEVIGLDAFPNIGEVPETGITFTENALLKACTVSRATGLVSVADDSGIEVDALNGAPGVYSARYSETPDQPADDGRNLQKLLQNIKDVPPAERTGRFRCSMAACTPAGKTLVAEGAWEGRIAFEPAGDNGFGYDPVFFDPEMQCTAAQMNADVKNSRSHRAKGVAALLEKWPDFWRQWLEANS